MEFPYEKEQKRVLTIPAAANRDSPSLERVNDGTLLTAKMGCAGLHTKTSGLEGALKSV